MKKYVFLLTGLCFLSVQVNAQVAFATAKELAMISRGVAKSVQKGNPLYIPGKARVGRTGLYPFQVKRVLTRRIAKTHRQALKAQKTLPQNRGLFLGKPVKRLDNLAPNLGKERNMASAYLTAHENRLFTQEVRRLQQTVYPKLDALLPRMRQEAAALVPPKDPLGFVVQKISPDINMLFVGEAHGFAEIQQTVGDLLARLRLKDPQREIILFAEFLPKDFVWKGKIPSWYKEPYFVPGFKYTRELMLWNRALRLNIEVVGLEPLEVCVTDACIPTFQPNDVIFPVSLTGGKFRNEQFLETLQQYRQEHPQALFVVYTGRGHVNYNAPYSLANRFKPEETFVLSLRPTQARFAQEAIVPEQQLEDTWLGSPILFTKKINLPQPFLYWADKELARTAGFDVHITVEEIKP